MPGTLSSTNRNRIACATPVAWSRGIRMPSQLLNATLLCALVTCAATGVHAATEYNPVAHEPRPASATQSLGVILKLRKNAEGAALMKAGGGPDRVAALSKRTGLAMSLKREISDAMLANVVELRGATPDQALAALRADDAVEYVSVDHLRFPHATTPNDSLFNGQWYLK